MEKDTTMVAVLEDLKDKFALAAIECTESFFQRESRIGEPWGIVERLAGTFDHIFSLGSSNQEYQAIMAVGISKDHMAAFVGSELDELDMVDAFGEFTNNYCALLNDSDMFRTRFGILRSAIPTHSLDQSFFPRVWGVNGKVYIGEKWMYLGYSIRKSII